MFSGFADTDINKVTEAYKEYLDIIGSGSAASYSQANALLSTLTDKEASYIAKAELAGVSTEEFSKSLTTMSKGAKIASAALNTVLTGLAIFAVSEVLNIIINYEKNLAKKIQDATNAYKQRVETLDSYKQSIKSLYDTINSDSTSFEDHVEANRQLLEIQQELIKNYGPEVSGINFVTNSIEEQTKAIEALENAKNSAYAMQDWENQANQYEQWQKIVSGIVTVGSYYDMLMNPMTIPEMQNFLGEKGYVSPDQIFDRPLDELVNKYTNFTKEISATTNRELNKIIASYDNITQEGNKFIISGNVDEVQKTILGIQHSLKNYSGYTQQWEDELINVYNTASEISKQFGDGYNQYLEKQILEEEEFVLEQQKLADAYNKYLEAITSGDNAKILVAIDEYKNAINTILKDGWMSDDLQQYIIGKYAGPVSSSYVELENQFNELKELRDKYQDELGEDPLFINKRRYSSIKDTYGSTVTAVTREMRLGAKEISEVSKQYDEAISTDAGQLYKLIGEQGLTAVDLLTTTDEKIQQLLARLAAQYTDGDIRTLINLLVQLDQVSDGTRENAAKKVLSNFQVTDARDRQQYSELEQEYIKLFESEGKEFTDWVNNELEVPDDVIYSVQELRDKWTEVLIARQKAAKVDDLNVNSTIAESVSNYSDRIKPWIDQLDDLYLSLKQEDGAFDLSKITNEDFQGIIDQFRAVSEATGIAFDEKELETFLYTLSDIEQKGGDVQEAFDRYATSLFNDVARLDGRLKDLNHNNANTFKQMLSQDGIENANEVVEYYLLLQDAGIELDKHIQTLTDNSVRAANARTVAAQEEAKAVTKSTYDEIAAMIQEKGATEELRDALYSLSAQELIRSGEIDINTSGGVQQLLNLAGAAGVTEKMLKALYALINAQGALDRAMSAGIEGKAYDKMDNAVQVAQERLNALMNQSLEMDLEIHPVAPDTDKGGAGDAGKEEADEYLEAFNAELENLDWLREQGFIDEKEYLDQLRILYERYFEGNDKYAKEFFENQRKYLQGLKDLYDNALSAITNLLDDEIEKYDDLEEKEKKVFEDEKKANDKKIKALEKVNKQLDKQIKALEKEQKAIQKQNIDPIEEQIKGREEAKKVLEEELSLMQKANDERQDAIDLQKLQYEMERAQHQKVNLVNTLCQAS